MRQRLIAVLVVTLATIGLFVAANRYVVVATPQSFERLRHQVTDYQIGIEAEGSIVAASDGSMRVAFWKPDHTVNINGDVRLFVCVNNGTAIVRAGDWYVYYHCDSGWISASHTPLTPIQP